MGLHALAPGDAATMIAALGEAVTMHTDTGVYAGIVAIWEEESGSGIDDPSGPALWVASASLPSDLRQGNVVERTGSDSVYTFVKCEKTGLGFERLILQADH